jgi:hypothetical protein
MVEPSLVQDLWKQWVAKLRPLHEPQPYKVASESPRCRFARVTSTPGVAPASLRLGLRVGELVLYSGMHCQRARDSSFPDLHPRGGARAWEALPANP